MASASSSFIQKSFKYDVFLSFRGEDTRKTFVDHLYYALKQKSIETYKDDEKIKKGNRISDELIGSIENSKFYIIVFSKNYASSTWCLDELVKIMECQKAIEHTAYPVFYDVEPTEIRKQIGAVGEAFAKHKNEDAGRWREALQKAAGLAGWELKNTLDGHEAKFIQKIVDQISLELRLINSSDDAKLVGMETRAKVIVSSLESGFDDVCMIGIKGMGGSGKTTLARAVYDKIAIWFEGTSFVENVREVSKESLSGLKKLQKQILTDVLNDQSIGVTSVNSGKNILKKMLRSRKVLLVLDDVDRIDQLEALAGEPNWFKSGSKIIITTRDEQVLAAHRVNFIHEANLLSHEEAICLFNRYAFGGETPIRGYEELSGKVVHYAAGLPLTVKALGSFLCGKTEHEWVDALERLKKIPEKQTFEKLELSFVALENDHKEIFLNVACILKGEMKEEVIRILESCGFYAQIGLRVLEQKSLITISGNDRVSLHDHVEEMGKSIIRRLHPTKPHRHSRLWIEKELKDILVKDMGTQATRYIKLRHGDLHPTIIMKGLRNMNELRYLYVNNRSFYLRKGHNDFLNSSWKFDEIYQYLPNSLRFIHWYYYPFWSLPKTFEANNLVSLEMCFSNISELWEDGESKVLKNLRFLNLSSSKLRTLNLGLTPNLESLDLGGCNEFVGFQLPVKCSNLRLLNATYSKLKALDLGLTPHLERLHLGGCNDFEELYMPVECTSLKLLDLRWSKLSNLNLGLTPHLERLDLRGCNEFVELQMDTLCQKLKSLDARWSKLSSLDLGLTPHLERLDLGGCNDFVELHLPVECPNLKILDLRWSKLSSLNLELIPHLEKLYVGGCNDFVELHMPRECLKLRLLNLSYSKLRSFDIGLTPHLEILDLRGCNDFVELYMPVECPKLKVLDIRWSKLGNLNLRLTLHLERLDLGACNNFVELQMHDECPKLKFLNMAYSKLKSFDLAMTPNIERLDLRGCNDFVQLHMPVECPKLQLIDLCWSKLSKLNLGLTPHLEKLDLTGCNDFMKLDMSNESPSKLVFLNLGYSKLRTFNLGLTPHLERLDLGGCNDFEELHVPVECPNLKFLNLSGSRLSNLNLGLTPHLEMLDIKECNHLEDITLSIKVIKHLPKSIWMLKHLKSLELKSCLLLEKLPDDLGQLECLEKLIITECKHLRDIPNNICKLKCLKYLHLSHCIGVEKLPEELGLLECLIELNIEGTSISHLPQSIFPLKGLHIIGFTGMVD
ncbi:TMV resistance protein N-like [Bidens hawaiensis]|uniref:TMV resistance protein N-like n=1 Tax=Bidens hawaiensis TaxID=980011 RepID=UPI0040499212